MATGLPVSSVFVHAMVDFNAPGARAANKQKQLLTAVGMMNDTYMHASSCGVLMPDFARPQMIHGLIDEVACGFKSRSYHI